MPLYQAHHLTLNDLLKNCSEDASVLIPNLQRPYVWMPDQVIRLVDSLLRGWPFSTLLLWNLGQVSQKETLIPSRAFWRIIDRTPEGNADKFGIADKPNDFRMVLDGQQRLQSLLLVFGAESAGLRLLDFDWAVSLFGTSSLRGTSAKKRWTVGRVYLDLLKLEDNLTESKFGLPNLRQDVDFTELLIWGYNGLDPDSRYITANDSKYIPPLPDISGISGENGRYINMAKLWKHCVGLGSRNADSQFDLCASLLSQHGVADDKISRILNGFVQFSLKLSAAQVQNVNFLELGTLASSGYVSQDEYNDAIVNIFTRLNSGGRTLTREEITFAWIKVSWDAKPACPFGSAEDAIAKLREICMQADPGLDLKGDEIVKILSFVWSIFAPDRMGALVRDRDLLDGATVRALANWLYEEMDVVRAAFIGVMESLDEQKIIFGEAYRSVNALAVLLACATGHGLLRKRLENSVTDGLSSEIVIKSWLRSLSQPWLILSQWAGEWAKSTDETMGSYAKIFSEKWKELLTDVNLSNAQASWSTTLRECVAGLRTKAETYVRQLEVEDRNQVRSYRAALWLWNRLNDERQEMVGLVLKDDPKNRASVEVDHIISWSKWEELSAHDPESLRIANKLGNCALLIKTFNISKGKLSLDEWLKRVRDFPSNEWKRALAIPVQMSAAEISVEQWKQEVALAIEQRTEHIKAELIGYIATAGVV